jgi:HSP20 family protein
MTKLMISPFREMLSLREAMDRLFDESFVRPFAGSLAVNGGLSLPVDIQATNDEYILTANVPGLKPEDLRLEVVDNTVTLRGEIKHEQKVEQEDYVLQERRYGQFGRTITLPTALNPAKAEAVVENGVLTVRLPKAEEARPKAITVKAKK